MWPHRNCPCDWKACTCSRCQILPQPKRANVSDVMVVTGVKFERMCAIPSAVRSLPDATAELQKEEVGHLTTSMKSTHVTGVMLQTNASRYTILVLG